MQVASILASTDIEQRAIPPEVFRAGWTGARRNPMTTMAPPRPAERQERHERQERRVRHGCRIQLATGPAAPAEARRRVRDAIRSWQVPVDLDAALLLTSELVTNAVRHEAGQGAQAVVLAIASSRGRLRVDVHDTSCYLPAVAEVPADAETGRGLLLVETLSDEWGFYRTPAGKAVYFTLASEAGEAGEAGETCKAGKAGKADQPDEAPATGGRGPQRVYARGRWTVTPPSEHRPRRAALAVPAARLPSA
jgi:anti-sigma regulatory factor (Ser/Thr protein kinase)